MAHSLPYRILTIAPLVSVIPAAGSASRLPVHTDAQWSKADLGRSLMGILRASARIVVGHGAGLAWISMGNS